MIGKIGAVVNYCSLDADTVEHVINKLIPVCDEIVVSFTDHLFSGAEEPMNKIHNIQRNYSTMPKVTFVMFEYDSSVPIVSTDPALLHRAMPINHNRQRYFGYKALSSNIEYVLFLDGDEVIDTARFDSWLKAETPGPVVYRFASYLYYLSSYLRAITTVESAGNLVRKKELDTLSEGFMLNLWMERNGIADWFGAKQYVKGLDGVPMVHHYSFVRSYEAQLTKVQAWAHRGDKGWNWVKTVEDVFTSDTEKEFWHGYKCEFLSTPYVVIKGCDARNSAELAEWKAKSVLALKGRL